VRALGGLVALDGGIEKHMQDREKSILAAIAAGIQHALDQGYRKPEEIAPYVVAMLEARGWRVVVVKRTP
jgi:hypothetical protein